MDDDQVNPVAVWFKPKFDLGRAYTDVVVVIRPPKRGLAIGYPQHPLAISKRLPLAVTVHHDRFSQNGVKDAVRSYDADRAATQPYQQQRFTDDFGLSYAYGWSHDKVRQYSQPERDTFGAFIRAKGFKLD